MKRNFEEIKSAYLENLENLRKTNLRELRKSYQAFIDTMPDEMQKLKSFINKEKLTYHPDEIDVVEAFYRKYIFETEKINLTEEALDKMVSTYFGLAYLWHFGGEWFLETHKSVEKYGLPCICNYGGKDYVSIGIPPSDWTYGLKSDQFDKPLSDMFRGSIEYFKNNPQHVFETVRDIC